VACASGRLVQFDANGLRLELDVAGDLRDVVIDDVTGKLWVSRFKSAEVLLVDRSGPLEVFRVPGFVDELPPSFVDSEFDPAVAWRMVADPEGGVVIVHQRARLTPVDIRVPSEPVPPEVERERPPVYYSPVELIPAPVLPDDTVCSGIVHGALTRLDADRSQETTPAIRAASLPTDLAIGPDGTAYVAAAGAREGTRADASVIAIDGSAFAPGSGCYEPAPVVQAEASIVTSVVVAPTGEVIALGEEPLELTVDGEPRYGEALVGNPAPLRQFHQNPSFGVTCAACHPEGHEDGHTWVFRTAAGDIQRRTQAMGAGTMETQPFHWDGEFETLGELMEEVWGRRMGGGTLSEAEVDGVGDYIDQFARPRFADQLPSLVADGRDVFERAACAACHSGERFTDNASYDVGTGGTFQVPSLVGVAARTPLMHDGCAPTLAARFFDTACGGDRHGVLQGLDQSDYEALIAYLRTL
ncbi:MAG: cytochrome c, partial [Myxococcota bacterium]